MKIHVLDSSVANLIAAGEVVERPASVVKELVENSVDAGATKISVEILDGGIGMIKVTDNGCGMSEEDARVAFKKHATSKISSKEDLYNIGTLGFRGYQRRFKGRTDNEDERFRQRRSSFSGSWRTLRRRRFFGRGRMSRRIDFPRTRPFLQRSRKKKIPEKRGGGSGRRHIPRSKTGAFASRYIFPLDSRRKRVAVHFEQRKTRRCDLLCFRQIADAEPYACRN